MADTDSRSGAGYATAPILSHLRAVHAPHDAALERAFTSPERDGLPAIQVGPAEGKTLHLLLGLLGARKVVEVGTLAGYSAIWMARALPPGGRLWTIEADPRHAEVARGNIAAAGLAERVEVRVGLGAEVLGTLDEEGPFDAVFLDADKKSYDVYGRWAARNVRSAGLLIADNVYLFGRLLEDSDEARAMRRFHEEAARAFDSVTVPTPDGLLVGRRRHDD